MPAIRLTRTAVNGMGAPTEKAVDAGSLAGQFYGAIAVKRCATGRSAEGAVATAFTTTERPAPTPLHRPDCRLSSHNLGG